MAKRIIAIIAIFILSTVAWMGLGANVTLRTKSSDRELESDVSDLWGGPQSQMSPRVFFTYETTEEQTEEVEDEQSGAKSMKKTMVKVWKREPMILDSSNVRVDLGLDYRKKGLLWYSTYAIKFAGDYTYEHRDQRTGKLLVVYNFPNTATYDNFRFDVVGLSDGIGVPGDEQSTYRSLVHTLPIVPGQKVSFSVGYQSRGMSNWHYSFGPNVNQVKNFTLTMNTNFKAIDFPQGSMSPTQKKETNEGWTLSWVSSNLISGFDIGMEMPKKLNPGPLVAQISFFAPISLLFFFAWMVVITLLRKIDLHPVNYLFLSAAFFSFHLLFAHLVDHFELIPSFIVSSVVSVFLVVSYLRLAVGLRFAAVEAGLSQLLYLVFFSYAHFLKGTTGLIVTIGSIITLFAIMQLTGRIKWSEQFAKQNRARIPIATKVS